MTWMLPACSPFVTVDACEPTWHASDYYEGEISGAVDKMLFGPMLGLDLEFRI